MDKKILVARQQIDDFYKTRFPSQNSAISDGLGKLAAESGVKIGQIKYKEKDPALVGLHPMEIDADFSGDYLHLVRFIISFERSPLLFIFITMELVVQQGCAVRLH